MSGEPPVSITDVRQMLEILKLKVYARETELLEEIAALKKQLLQQAVETDNNNSTYSKWVRSNNVKVTKNDNNHSSAVEEARILKKNLSRSNPKNQHVLERQEPIDPKEVEALKKQIKAKIDSIESEVLSKSPENTNSSGSVTYTTAELQEMLESLNNLPHIIY